MRIIYLSPSEISTLCEVFTYVQTGGKQYNMKSCKEIKYPKEIM